VNKDSNESPIEEISSTIQSNNISSAQIQEFQKKVQQDIDELQQKYSEISIQIQELQNDKSDLKNNIRTINDSFQQVSKNVEDILAKLDNIGETKKDLDNDTMDRKIGFSTKKILFNPLRKLTVAAVSSVLAVVYKTSELTCGVKEGFDDIVTQAQYHRRRKQMTIADELYGAK
jgi:chromosome segregation ATPase